MSLLRTALSRLCRVLGSSPSDSRQTRSNRRPGTSLTVESLEGREVPAGMGVGMNLDWITDYAPAWVFTDAFQQSRTWMSQEYNTVTRVTNFQSSRPVNVDADGWPTQLDSWTNELGQVVQQRAVAVMYLGTNGAEPAGVYHARWSGDAALSFYGDARVVAQGVLADGQHFAELNVTPSNAGIFLRIDSMSSANPIRDLHVWLPDYNGQSFTGQVWHPGADFSPFHPAFLERLQPFDTIRFMQAADTITSDIVHVEDGRPLNHARQSTFATDFQNGMSPEYMIEMANELHANAWFNMPHMADDDYVRQFATLVRDTLDPNVTAYVEWSNEVWNWAPGFESHYWARAQADAEGIPLEQFVARETRRDFAIWSDVFAGQEDRLVRVVGGFTPATGQYGWNAQVMSQMNGEFDALAIAPYIAPPQTVRATYTTETTVDQVIADTRANIAPVTDMVRQDAALVRQYEAQLGRDLQLLGYEGGTHLDIRGGEVYQRAFFDAAADPRMYGIVSDYLTAMANAGMDSFNYYKFTDRRVPSLMNPDFGTLNRMDQPLETAHRYRALVDYIAAPPSVPPAVVSIAATDPNAAETGNNTATFTVSRVGGHTDEPLSVSYTVSGTATPGVDYVALSGTVVISAGALSATVTVTPVDDTAVEPLESIILTLADRVDYDLGVQATATAGLASDDTILPTVGICIGDSYAAEAGRNTALFYVGRDNASLSMPVTVRYSVGGTATNGRDYGALSGVVTIPAGQVKVPLLVTPIDDTEVEGVESITLTLVPNANYRPMTGNTTAAANLYSDDVAPPPATRPLPVLMVIANQDFYYQEYSDTRMSLEQAGIGVVVAAATRTTANPHWNSGQGADGGSVMPDLALTDANAANYSAIVFVGGWGASSYQYGFSGTYYNTAYNGSTAVEQAANNLINDFVDQDKYVTAICHGVSVLAWARVSGASPIAGRTVVAYGGSAPTSDVAGSTTTRWHVETNGAAMLGSRSVGDPTTATDDVVVDGKIITAENFDSARMFGQVIAAQLQA